MGYIGNIPAEKYSAFTKQDFSTSATTSYTLSQAVANENEIALFINFVRQEPTTAYTASGTSLTLTSATSASDDMYCVYLGKAVQTVNPPSGSVGSSQVEASIITGQTALGATPADTDELLISDAGTLKRVDYSYLKSANTPAFEAYRTSNQTLGGNNTWTKVQFNVERFDTAGNYDNSTNYRFTPTTSGKYFVYAHVKLEAAGVNANGFSQTAIHFNGSSIGNAIIDVRDTSSNGGKTFTVPISTVINFNGSSDYVEIYAKCFDNTGATPTILADSTGVINTIFGAYKLIGV